MKRHKLRIEELQVESFDTTPAPSADRRGTVLGYDGETTFPQIICGTCDSYPPGCGGGGSDDCGDTGPVTNVETCATGFQIICGCN